MYGKCVLAAVCVLLTAALVRAQEMTTGSIARRVVSAQSATFKSGVDMVPLTVTVTDTIGKHVTGLRGNDFTVFEDGVEQPLSFFASEDVPVDVALVLDTSASMGADLLLVQSAAGGLVRKLRASDRGAVVEVKESAGILQPFTSDRSRIEEAIRGLSTSGSTALYDGIYVMLKEFERERRATLQVRRQVLVLLSDGLDNTSRLAFEDVMDLARRVGVNIYVIALRGDVALRPRAELNSSTLQAKYTMGAVARESGGRTFFPKSARELPAIYTAIAQELASQYELGYMPARPGGDGAFRRVMVRVPPHTNALARTRSGYYAPRTRAGM
jgi:Ca-activated chloride channel family protein